MEVGGVGHLLPIMALHVAASIDLGDSMVRVVEALKVRAAHSR